MNLKDLSIDRRWSLFLDRDGVINRRIPGGYVKTWEEFEFLPQVPRAIRTLGELFGRVFIVSNQQGIGKGLMDKTDLETIHSVMLEKIAESGGRVDRVYYSPYLEEEDHPTRKPNTGMALAAVKEFPEVHLERSVMVGDAVTDIQFGKDAGMVTVLLSENPEQYKGPEPDLIFKDLIGFAEEMEKTISKNP